MGSRVDLVGNRFGKLTVLRDVGRKFGGVLWECRCDCGKVVEVRQSSLKCGDRKSCGQHGPCHHHWQGGHGNPGSVAWAKKVLASGRIRSGLRGYAAPTNDPERVVELWREANSSCPICDCSEDECGSLHLDHCHETGALRGFICGACNSALGYCDDSPERLRRCADYLEASWTVAGQVW